MSTHTRGPHEPQAPSPSDPCPCDGCLNVGRCRAQQLACWAFSEFLAGRNSLRWRNLPRVPSAEQYAELFPQPHPKRSRRASVGSGKPFQRAVRPVSAAAEQQEARRLQALLAFVRPIRGRPI